MVAEHRPYHHGNLRAELVAAGLELARSGGPAALSLREATRVVGVSPNAAYRHFANRDALLGAVSEQVQQLMAEAMLRRWPKGTGRRAARTRLRAVGLGYIEFAVAEPGWFATFLVPGVDRPPGAPVAAPFARLTEALDAMVTAGLLSPAGRRGAEWPCWSAVHGFAQLAIQGPLRQRPTAEIRRMAAVTVDTIIDGVLAGS